MLCASRVSRDVAQLFQPLLLTNRNEETVLSTGVRFGCWSLVLLFRLNDNRVVSSVTVLVMTSETVFGGSPKRTPGGASSRVTPMFKHFLLVINKGVYTPT